ncbi:MAG TPA: hypothetical protein VJI66_02155 [Candidatus Paceibacterota bacterium]
MSKRQWLCILGAWVMIFLFLGVPSLWHKILALLSGLIIIIISYNIPPEKKQNNNSGESSFTENPQ